MAYILQDEMQRFVKKIKDLMQKEMLFFWQGGPIIMLQIENEYGNVENSFGQRVNDYVNGLLEWLLSQNAGVPWVMCQQVDAPNIIINACHGFYCESFWPNSANKPKMWRLAGLRIGVERTHVGRQRSLLFGCPHPKTITCVMVVPILVEQLVVHTLRHHVIMTQLWMNLII